MRQVFLIFFLLLLFCGPVTGQDLGSAAAVQADAGQLLSEQGRFAEAYQYYFTKFQEDPQNIEINFQLGRAAFGLGDFEAAIMAFERVLILDPDAAEVKVELGKSFYRLGSTETAIQYLEEALAADLPDEVRAGVQDFLQQLTGGGR